MLLFLAKVRSTAKDLYISAAYKGRVFVYNMYENAAFHYLMILLEITNET